MKHFESYLVTELSGQATEVQLGKTIVTMPLRGARSKGLGLADLLGRGLDIFNAALCKRKEGGQKCSSWKPFINFKHVCSLRERGVCCRIGIALLALRVCNKSRSRQLHFTCSSTKGCPKVAIAAFCVAGFGTIPRGAGGNSHTYFEFPTEMRFVALFVEESGGFILISAKWLSTLACVRDCTRSQSALKARFVKQSLLY